MKILGGEDSLVLVFGVSSVCRLGALPPLPGRGLLQLPLNHSLLMISAVSPRRTAGNTSTTSTAATLLIQPPAPNPASPEHQVSNGVADHQDTEKSVFGISLCHLLIKASAKDQMTIRRLT